MTKIPPEFNAQRVEGIHRINQENQDSLSNVQASLENGIKTLFNLETTPSLDNRGEIMQLTTKVQNILAQETKTVRDMFKIKDMPMFIDFNKIKNTKAHINKLLRLYNTYQKNGGNKASSLFLQFNPLMKKFDEIAIFEAGDKSTNTNRHTDQKALVENPFHEIRSNLQGASTEAGSYMPIDSKIDYTVQIKANNNILNLNLNLSESYSAAQNLNYLLKQFSSQDLKPFERYKVLEDFLENYIKPLNMNDQKDPNFIQTRIKINIEMLKILVYDANLNASDEQKAEITKLIELANNALESNDFNTQKDILNTLYMARTQDNSNKANIPSIRDAMSRNFKNAWLYQVS